MFNRMLRALRLDVQLFEEVEADTSATKQAALVVVLVSLATGVMLLAIGHLNLVGLIVGVAVQLVGWAAWAWLNYFIGTRLLKEPQTEADWGQLARTMGFAYTPGIFVLILFIPVPILGVAAFLITQIWKWAAMTIAVRQALDYRSTLRAVAVTFVGFVVNGVILGVILRRFASDLTLWF